MKKLAVLSMILCLAFTRTSVQAQQNNSNDTLRLVYNDTLRQGMFYEMLFLVLSQVRPWTSIDVVSYDGVLSFRIDNKDLLLVNESVKIRANRFFGNKSPGNNRIINWVAIKLGNDDYSFILKKINPKKFQKKMTLDSTEFGTYDMNDPKIKKLVSRKKSANKILIVRMRRSGNQFVLT
jgi:hypothetical protein